MRRFALLLILSACAHEGASPSPAPPAPASAAAPHPIAAGPGGSGAPPPATPAARDCPAVFARGQSYVTDLAVYDGAVYWVAEGTLKKGFSDGAVRKAPVTGGAPETVADVWGPRKLFADATGVYWTAEPTVLHDGRYVGSPASAQAGSLWYLPHAGGAPREVARGLVDPLGVALEGDRLFVASGRGLALVTLPRPGGAPTLLGDTDGRVSNLALDHTHVYFTVDAYHTGKVGRAPIAGGPVEVLVSGLDRPWGVAVDDRFVYFTTEGGFRGDQALLRIAKGATAQPGSLERLASLPRPRRLVRQGDWLYVATDQGVAKIARSGGAPQFLPGPQASVMAVDGRYVYVAQPDDESIACVLDAGG
jgi:hypothetical protein